MQTKKIYNREKNYGKLVFSRKTLQIAFHGEKYIEVTFLN